MIKTSGGRLSASPGTIVDSATDAEPLEPVLEPPGRALHRQWVEDLVRAAAETDLSVRENFHHMIWLIMALGGNQTAFAERHGYQPTTVSRWVNGAVAPPKLRRRPIVLDALEHLQSNLLDRIPVPLRPFSDDESDRTPAAAAGRPTRRPTAFN